ncbi:ABC-type branched-chain amino acid transport system, permease component [Halanaeroarchaeum sp. HSR-CO]|uniref:branched-chain amino acid ABC transporter permease n=1 Tax=Halanaeroarchaeum sp. HSR-CO TaxID=2866382 RepID=UPI00217D76C6|nr:branched-chain amino acid ABC transporter permease [Halanaeroarchaeum sp. HSR-CO]UWG47447.1 ABC-type branched-chain amino acid transport system, permease component [Halanaeroarchaeum sp. HSR-CO]
MTADSMLPGFGSLNRVERLVAYGVLAVIGLLGGAVLAGVIEPTYLLFLLSLAGMYLLLSMGLNVHWGYTGLINFSVAAFFGIGAYGTALLTSNASPLVPGLYPPIFGLVIGMLGAVVLAILIAIPTLRLRADYLAIASLGLAEVVRLLILNERQWTAGSQGISEMPRFWYPFFSGSAPGWAPASLDGLFVTSLNPLQTAFANFLLIIVLIVLVYWVLKRLHRSPWGRVQRTIRAEEDLAEALGKDTYSFKMQSFILGSVIMAIAGAYYAHLNLFIAPGDLNPIRTFYVWVAVILGGSGSNRGALLGGFVIVFIIEGTRFVNGIGLIPFDIAPFRLFLIGLLIVLIMKFRPQGILPPQNELIVPSAMKGDGDE